LSVYDVEIGDAAFVAVVMVVVVLPLLAHALIPMVAVAIPASMQAIDFFIKFPSRE
jgi:hypothetical protein